MDTEIPPGLEGNLSVFAEGGRETPWRSFEGRLFCTNAFIISDDKLLLGFKKRGFGAGLYNGFGGKVEPGETVLAAACRELEEESGINADLEHAGTLLFVNEGTELAFHIEIYSARSYTGTPVETDEMRPAWFSLSPESLSGTQTIHRDISALPSSSTDSSLPLIPYDKMWPDDIYWLPQLVDGQKFAGRADFRMESDGNLAMQRFWFGFVGST
ncbi:NUDIX hydrolase domain-like protein [Phlebopus sp. FC_14]|nr:NUDIX hydrolase domain-like protein [Phlebopus sp. FC_14]